MKSYQYTAAVRDYSKTEGPARLVLMMIASRVDDEGCCYPSYQCLARDTKLSLRTVARAIRQIPSDELEIVDQGGSPKGDHRRPTKYRIIIRDRSQPDHGLSSNHSQCDDGQNGDLSQPDHRTVVSHDTDRSQPDYLTNKELPIELPKARKRAAGSSSSASASKQETADPPVSLILQTPMFLAAWNDYDAHRRKLTPKAWTSLAKKKAISQCEKWGAAKAAEALNQSVMNGWKGIFEPKDSSNRKPRPGPSLDESGLPKL